MSTLTIAALSTPQTISAAALERCKNAKTLYVQTERTPCVLPLTQANLSYQTMDDLYETAEDFDALNAAIADRLLAACNAGEVVYAVPGSGRGEALCELVQLAKGAGIGVEFLPGAGFAQAAMAAAGQVTDQLFLAAANSLPDTLNPFIPLAVEELDTRILAGEVKLALLEYYPDEHPVRLFSMQENGTYEVRELPLLEVDRQDCYAATTVLFVPPAELLQLSRFGYGDLERVMHRLRAPGGCPWDREQTHESLKKTLIEECYETIDAIDRNDIAGLCEELGDVLLQCVFHAEIAREQGLFYGRDVTTGIVQKLIYRHPHIFGTSQADTADAVVVKWEQLKKAEKHFDTQSDVLRAVPKTLPALMRAYKLQKKAAQVGFDWENADQAFPKLAEETDELSRAMRGDGNVAEEVGDLLFAVVNVARLLHLEPEQVLSDACEKFTARFCAMEELALTNGRSLETMLLWEQDELWKAVKNAEIRQK